MAEKLKIKDILQNEKKYNLDGAVLSVTTHQDSYTKVYGGVHGYKIVKTEDEYGVFELIDGVKHDLPIILTDGEQVFYTAQTRINPYDFPYSRVIPVTAELTKDKAVLEAFLAFIQEEYQFGPSRPFHVFIQMDTEELEGATEAL